jgi:uncharacterized membrane protein YvbJ
MKNCKNCGQQLQLNWKVCPNCSTKIETNQELEYPYKPRRKVSNQIAGICLLIFGIIFTLISMGLLYYENYYANLEDRLPEAIVGPSLMVAFGFIIILGAIYMIWKKPK